MGGDGGINVTKLGFNCSPSKTSIGIFPVVQWLRLHLPTQRVRLRSLVRELRFHMPHGQKQTTTKTYNQYCNKFNNDHLKWSTSNNMFKKKMYWRGKCWSKGKIAFIRRPAIWEEDKPMSQNPLRRFCVAESAFFFFNNLVFFFF